MIDTLDETEVIESSQTEVVEEPTEDTAALDKTNESESMLEEMNNEDGDEKNNDEDDEIVEGKKS